MGGRGMRNGTVQHSDIFPPDAAIAVVVVDRVQ